MMVKQHATHTTVTHTAEYGVGMHGLLCYKIAANLAKYQSYLEIENQARCRIA